MSIVHEYRFFRIPVLISLCLAIFYCPAYAAGGQCSADDILALVKAGYSKQDVDSICPVSASFFGRSGRVDLSSSAISRFINSVTPLDMDGPDRNVTTDRLTLKDLKYCRASDDHQGELLAYGEVGAHPVPKGPAPSAFEDADCTRSLNAVSKRVIKNGAGPTKAFVARLSLLWVPWELRLRLLEIQGNGGVLPPSVVAFPTNVIPVTVGKQVVPLSAAFYFFNDSISVMLVPSGDVAAISDVRFIPKLSSFADSYANGGKPTADVTVRVTHRAINYFVDTYFSGDQVIVVETGNQTLGTLTMRQLHGDPAGVNQYAVSGVLSDNKGTSFLIKAVAKGDDLAVDGIEMKPQNLASCPPLSFNPDTLKCHAGNAALEASAALIGSVVTGVYRGKLLRTLGRPDVFRLTLGKLSCDISGVVSYVTSTDKYVRMDGDLKFSHP
jgi:hypothetical protein